VPTKKEEDNNKTRARYRVQSSAEKRKMDNQILMTRPLEIPDNTKPAQANKFIEERLMSN
jgi:hypothetical protein